MTRNTIFDCISDLAADIDGQFKEKVASFVAFSVAIDESTDITDIAQLAIFICRVDASLTVTEDILGSLVGTLENVRVDWAHAVSVATDGAPLMIGKKTGVVAKLKEKVHTANGGLGFWAFHYTESH